jgi:hypothetical protein
MAKGIEIPLSKLMTKTIIFLVVNDNLALLKRRA